MGDIRVQRGRVVISGTALSGSTSIDTVDTSKAFVRINGMLAQQGATSGVAGGLVSVSQVAGTPTFLTASSVQVARQSGSGIPSDALTCYDFEVWEYTGPDGGPNEFIVHAFTSIVPPAGAVTVSVFLPGMTVAVAQARGLAVLCGINNDNFTNAWGLATWYSNPVAGFLGFPISQFVRQFGSFVMADTCRISYAVLEFRGSNWSDTEHSLLTVPAASGDSWVSGPVTLDRPWAQTLPFYSWNVGSTTNPLNFATVWFPGDGEASGAQDNTQFSARRRGTGVSSNHVVWAVTNPEIETRFARSDINGSSGTGEGRLPAISGDVFTPILEDNRAIPSLPRVGAFSMGLTLSGVGASNDTTRIFQLVSAGIDLRTHHDPRGGTPRTAGWGLVMVSWPSVVSASLQLSGTLSGQGSRLRGVAVSMSGILTLSGDASSRNVCDWFTAAAGEDWASADTAEWYDAKASPDWFDASAEPDWQAPASGSWITPKECP